VKVFFKNYSYLIGEIFLLVNSKKKKKCKRMKEMILMLVGVEILVFGMYFVFEEIYEDIPFEDLNLSGVSPEESWRNVASCDGSGGHDVGDIPG
jgi:hypothetical protein